MQHARLLILLVLFLTSATILFGQVVPETFNVTVYEGIYPDIMNVYGTGNLQGATDHWTNFGLPAGRRGSFIFDPVYYLQHNPDLAAAFGSTGYVAAEQHFLNTGLPVEGRRGSLEFDVKYYIRNNPDVSTDFKTAADHFLTTGLVQGRRGSADFSVQDYVNMYPDVAAGYGPTDYTDAMLHWLRRGKAQGRVGFGAPFVSTECMDGQTGLTTESATVPLASPFNFTVAHAGAFVSDGGVIYVDPPQGAPPQVSTSLYTVVNGVYTFSSSLAGVPLRISYNMTPVPAGYNRIFIGNPAVPPPSGVPLGSSATNPFDVTTPDKFDDLLRGISENGQLNGATVSKTNWIVCVGPGTFRTRGTWDFVMGVGHTLPDSDPSHAGLGPGGFTVNQNWHIHGASETGANATTLQLYQALINPPVRSFNTGDAFGMIISTHDGLSSGVEVSDLILDGNYNGLQGPPLNLLAINLISDNGNNYIHRINVVSSAGQTNNEAFPILVGSFNGANSPEVSNNNLIEYVLMSGFHGGTCTAIAISRAQAEIRNNVVNAYQISYGGWDMGVTWFHDNFSLNSISHGFNIDSLLNRDVTIEFNNILNFSDTGLVIGGGGTYANFLIQYNTISMSAGNTRGIRLQGNVTGGLITRNDMITPTTPSGSIGFNFAGNGNTGNQFEYNQISSRFSNDPVPSQNCVFSNWNESSVQLANLPNTQSSPCATSQPGVISAQVDSVFNTLEVYYQGGDHDIHLLTGPSNTAWPDTDISLYGDTPRNAASNGALSAIVNTVTQAPELYFLGSDMHVYDLYRNSVTGWHSFDPVGFTGAPTALVAPGALTALMDTVTNSPEIYYAGSDRHVHQLYWNPACWCTADITVAAAGPLTDTLPVFTSMVNTLTGSPEIYYEGSNHHVYDLYWNSVTGWHSFDVSGFTGAPNAASQGGLTSLVDTVQSHVEIYYVATDAHIHQLYWTGACWCTFDVSAFTGAAPAATGGGKLTSVVDPNRSAVEIYYVGTDAHIHQLYWSWATGWQTSDVTAQLATPSVVGGVKSLFDNFNGSVDVFFLGADQHMYELSFNAGGWHKFDITAGS